MTKALELHTQKLKKLFYETVWPKIHKPSLPKLASICVKFKETKKSIMYTLLLHLYRRLGVEWRGHRYWLKIEIQIVECIRLKLFQNNHSNIRFSFKLLSCLQKSKIILFFKLKTEQHFNNFGYRLYYRISWGRIFSCVRPFYERAVSDLDRSTNRSLWVQVAHSSFIEVLLSF